MFEANNKKIILHDDIDGLYNRFVELNNSFGDTHRRIDNNLSNITSSYYRSGGKGTIVLVCRMMVSYLTGVRDVLSEGAELLRMSKESMRTLDETIRAQINKTDFPIVGKMSYGDVHDDGTEVWTTEKDYWEKVRQDQIIEDYNQNPNTRIPIENTNEITCGQATFYFNWGCTWYAAYRFKQVTGLDLEFTESWGNNAEAWDNHIDRTKFNVNPTSDINSIVAPAVAVQEATSSNGYGHVVFIEAVRDGKVYYSESSYGNTAIAGRISCISVEEFMSKFQSVITAI